MAPKGKNFVTEEEKQLCVSFLHVSQDPYVGNGRKSVAFWERVKVHYNENRPPNGPERPARSLETKWHTIKHDVSKFMEAYGSILASKEPGMSSEDTLQKALELYKLKHPKNQSFTFIDCWLMLRDVPRWIDPRDDIKRATLTTEEKKFLETSLDEACDVREAPNEDEEKRPTSPDEIRETPAMEQKLPETFQDLACDVREIHSSAISEGSGFETPISVGSGFKRPEGLKLKRPQGSKTGKETHKRQKGQESAWLAQAKATADMAAATLMKAKILEDQHVMALFSMPDDQILSEEAREYFKLRRREELAKLKSRLQVAAPQSTISDGRA